jgi:hypothetical protein
MKNKKIKQEKNRRRILPGQSPSSRPNSSALEPTQPEIPLREGGKEEAFFLLCMGDTALARPRTGPRC